MNAFEEGQFDVVEIVYSQFKNAATQKFEVERFLPIPKVAKKAGATKADFIFCFSAIHSYKRKNIVNCFQVEAIQCRLGSF